MTAHKLSSATRLGTLSILVALISGCAGDRVPFPGSGRAPPSEPAVAAPKPPPISMAGSWTMRSMGGQCTMNLGQADPGAAEGTVAPGGGCPGNFFTTRRWTYDADGLLLSNHNNQPMALLKLQGDGFGGNATAGGAPVSLTR